MIVCGRVKSTKLSEIRDAYWHAPVDLVAYPPDSKRALTSYMRGF